MGTSVLKLGCLFLFAWLFRREATLMKRTSSVLLSCLVAVLLSQAESHEEEKKFLGDALKAGGSFLGGAAAKLEAAKAAMQKKVDEALVRNAAADAHNRKVIKMVPIQHPKPDPKYKEEWEPPLGGMPEPAVDPSCCACPGAWGGGFFVSSPKERTDSDADGASALLIGQSGDAPGTNVGSRTAIQGGQLDSDGVAGDPTESSILGLDKHGRPIFATPQMHSYLRKTPTPAFVQLEEGKKFGSMLKGVGKSITGAFDKVTATV